MTAEEDDFPPRSFCVHHKAWYQAVLKERDNVSVDIENHEIIITWHEVSGGYSAHLEMYDESFRAFALCSELFTELSTFDAGVTVDDVVSILLRLGFVDKTAYVRTKFLDEHTAEVNDEAT